MEFTTALALFATLISLATFGLKLAELKEETWDKVRAWGKRSARAAHICYCVAAIGNGSAGIYLFANGAGDPSRRDIMYLLLFISNIAVGIWQFNEVAKSRSKPTQ